jgi:hypothetical protein
MILNKNKSEKLQKEYKKWEERPIQVGDTVFVPDNFIFGKSKYPVGKTNVKVVSVNGDKITVKRDLYKDDIYIVDLKNCTRSFYNIGANPISKYDWTSSIIVIRFDLETIYKTLFDDDVYIAKGADGCEHEIKNLNWNPYVFDKDGNKEYYQRDFVWTIEQKQLFIESMYKRINCGMIIVRKHDYEDIKKEFKKGNYDISFYDIVDGKQRLNAIHSFINNEFPDLHGNYFNDFSEDAIRSFSRILNIAYAEMNGNTTDKSVINTFLNVNFTGVPMSKEHIEYVQKINEKM